MAAYLQIEGLVQYYGRGNILRGVDLEVPEGRCACLLGRNGVGKTTLVECLMGLLPVRKGRILLGGRDATSWSSHERARRGLGYVPQGRQIFPLLSVEENLRVPLAARADRGRTVPERVYELFPDLEKMRARRGGDLSGGQQQQLAMARALVLEPRVLILDEPTEGIQPNIVSEIVALVRKLTHEDGMTVLQVEQKVPVARKVADSYAIMERGRVVASGMMADLDAETIKSRLAV
ncbi:MAG: urea ABC transporter ATP-binding subunit UrtE [Deltaproteobacteria bacterium]|jgi:urea transport system ATP-binding protein|nr:urea ABC transporter ATP-binding subunit UrtE [Deltaproteobacteria bacterium]